MGKLIPARNCFDSGSPVSATWWPATERYLDPGKAGKGDRLVDDNLLGSMVTEKNLGKLRKLHELSRQWSYGMAELTLAYSLSLPGLASVIPSSTSTKQLEANALAGTIDLSAEQIQQLKTVLE